MKKANNFVSFLFALVAIGGAIVAVCAYLKAFSLYFFVSSFVSTIKLILIPGKSIAENEPI